MKSYTLLSLPLVILAACSDLNPKEKEKPETQNNTQVDPGPPPLEQPTDGIDFSDVDTSNTLLTDDKKKTVTGPAPTTKPIEGDNVISVTPPLPTPTLPDE